MLTKEQIKDLSNRFQIDSYSILREYLQLLFLKNLYELKESQKIYFKGGTAIHFLNGSFRFSEDLDFTSSLNAPDIMKLSEETVRRISYEVTGLELVHLGTKAHSLNQLIKYPYTSRHNLTVRLEFSLREKPMTHKLSPIETPFPIASYPLVMHLDIDEILAEKVRALLTRHKGRDLFDLWFLLSKGVKLNEDYIRSKLQWYRMDYHISDLVAAVKKFMDEDLDKDLRKFLPKNYRPFIRQLKNRTLEKLSL